MVSTWDVCFGLCSWPHSSLDERLLNDFVVPHAMQFIAITTLWRDRANRVVFWFIALNGTQKCKKKKKKKKIKTQEQQEPPDLDSTAAAEAEGQVEAKRNEVEEQEATDAAASGMCACMHPLTLP